MKRGAAAFVLAASVAASIPAGAQAPAAQRVFDKAADRRDPTESAGDVLLWQSGSVSRQEIPRDLASLYDVLYRYSALPTVQHVDAAGRPIAAILRERELVFGAYFPVEIDRVLCSLNRPVCRISGPELAPVWSNRAGDTLTLPDLKFTKVRILHGENKSRKDSIKAIVRARNGCDTYDESCWALIERLNRATLGELDRVEGQVIIPALTIRATLPGTVPTAARAKLAENLVATAVFKEQSASIQDPLFGDQKEIFGLIKHPFASGDEVRDCSRIHVGVIDNEFGKGISEHCEFRTDPGARCGHNGGVARRADHGTHVAGIIAARANGRGVVGMSPTVKLHTGSYVSGLDGNTAELHQKIGSLYGEGVDVFNLSFEYKLTSSAQADTAEDAIKLLESKVLFVAAAGNDGQDKSKVCDVRPACFGKQLNNVISVIAIDRHPDVPGLWSDSSGTSNSGNVFDLAAPGENILSTILDDGAATMSGTSQAAPMVTSAAALLLAVDHKLRPREIKRRLIATSDFLPSLADKALGGRLNVKRAIEDVQTDVFELSDGQTVKGLLADNNHKIDVLKQDGSNDDIVTTSILRWTCDDSKVCTFVFVDRSGKLDKWVNAQVRSSTQRLRTIVNKRVEMLNPADVKDFIAGIKDGTR